MIEIEVLENKIFFKKGMMLVGPLDLERFYSSIVEIASELNEKPVLILSLYIGNRNIIAVRNDEEILIQDMSGVPFTPSIQTQ